MDATADRLARLSGQMAGFSRQAYAALCRHDHQACKVYIEQALDAYDRDQEATLERIRAMEAER